MPLIPVLMTDLCNLQQEQFQNKRGGSSDNMSCTILYTKVGTVICLQHILYLKRPRWHEGFGPSWRCGGTSCVSELKCEGQAGYREAPASILYFICENFGYFTSAAKVFFCSEIVCAIAHESEISLHNSLAESVFISLFPSSFLKRGVTFSICPHFRLIRLSARLLLTFWYFFG